MDRVCYSCHTDAEAKFTKTYTHKPVATAPARRATSRTAPTTRSCSRPKGAKLCASCHAELMKPLDGGAKHAPFVEGMCLTCHDPHGSNVKGMAVDTLGTLCAGCHSDVKDARGRGEVEARAGRGRRVHERATTRTRPPLEQPAAGEDGPTCASRCHKALKASMDEGARARAGREGLPALPQAARVGREAAARPAGRGRCAPSCHDVGTARVRRRPPADRAGADPVRALPRRARARRTRSSSRATRTRRSPRRTARSATSRREPRSQVKGTAMGSRLDSASLVTVPSCSAACAVGRAQQNPYRLKDPDQQKLCLACHSDFEQTLKKRFVHTPVQAGECSGCHSPHVSSHGKLLVGRPAARSAPACHDSVIPANAQSTHKVVADGQCVKCHDPHASDNAGQPRGERATTCASAVTRTLGDGGREGEVQARPGRAGVPDLPRAARVRQVRATC